MTQVLQILLDAPEFDLVLVLSALRRASSRTSLSSPLSKTPTAPGPARDAVPDAPEALASTHHRRAFRVFVRLRAAPM